MSLDAAKNQFFGPKAQLIETALPQDKVLMKAVRKQVGVRLRPERTTVWRVILDNHLVGWLFEDNVIGKHEFITYSAGVDLAGNVTGVGVLTYRETHGQEITEKTWLNQFVGKTVSDPFKMDQDIDGISGATLSVRNVTDGVKKLLVVTDVLRAQTPSQNIK